MRPHFGPQPHFSTGGTPLSLNCDDCFKENVTLPFSFPFFGQSFTGATVSSNGSLYFFVTLLSRMCRAQSTELAVRKMIAGLWDDLDLRTSSRADADVYSSNQMRAELSFAGRACPVTTLGSGCTGGTRSISKSNCAMMVLFNFATASGNTNLFPVVGISGGEPMPM